MFRRKKNNQQSNTAFYDSDAIYRDQSIYGGSIYTPQQGTYVPPSPNSGYVPPNVGYQPPAMPNQDSTPSVGYRPPLFPGSAELAEVVPEPEVEEPEKKSRSVVLKKSLQNMANSLRKVQDRARRSSIANTEETDEERSIKNLFTERIVKGRPDLFVASTPAPSTPSVSTPSTPRFEVLQSNITGFFSQFTKQQQNTQQNAGEDTAWSEKLREFYKRFGRNDTQYLRDALNNFCDETARMYKHLIPEDYIPSPTQSPMPDMTPTVPVPSDSTPKPSQAIEDRIHSFTDALMTEVRKHKVWKNATDDVLKSTRDCIEMVIMEKLRACTLGAIREEMKKEDEELRIKMENLQFLTMENLDVSAICKENIDVMNKVMEQLQRIQNVSSPAEKLECVILSCRTLGALLQSGNKSGNDAGADDFLPAFIYTVLKSGIQKLPSTVEYISRFRHPDELLSEGGYCLTNLSGAVSFLHNCGGCDFDIDADEFERQYNKSAPPPPVVEDEEDFLCF